MSLAHSPVGGKRWMRLYFEALTDPKVQKLSPHLFKAWVNLLLMAGLNNGRLPSTSDVSYYFHSSEQDTATYIDDLILAGLIDVLPDRSLSPHNWDARQYTSDRVDPTAAGRMKKYRQRKVGQRNDPRYVTRYVTHRNATVTVTADPSVSVSESESNNSPSQEKYSEVPTRAGVHVGTRNAYARAKAGEGSV